MAFSSVTLQLLLFLSLSCVIISSASVRRPDDSYSHDIANIDADIDALLDRSYALHSLIGDDNEEGSGQTPGRPKGKGKGKGKKGKGKGKGKGKKGKGGKRKNRKGDDTFNGALAGYVQDEYNDGFKYYPLEQ